MNANHSASPGRHARSWGPGVLLRRLSGANESVLDMVPSERGRYTAMGSVVLGIATVAMVSMSVVLHAIFGTWASPAVIGFAVLWGFIILNFDRWLMSIVVDRDGLARVVRFLPRIVLAVLFGAIIAEPLLLAVFNSAIERQASQVMDADAKRYEANLLRCNPTEQGAARPSDCGGAGPEGFVIPLTNPTGEQELLQAQEQAEKLRTQVQADAVRLKELDDLALAECAGIKNSRTTGQEGYGPECTKRYAERDSFRAQYDRNVLLLQGLDAKVIELSRTVGNERNSIETRRNEEIARRVAKRSGSGQIGLLERLRAMQELVEQNGYMLAAQWALRIFFIALDSMPALLKLFTGRTVHDRILVERLAREERAAQLAEGSRGYRDAVAAGVRRYIIDLEGAAERDRAQVHASWANRDTEEELRRLVDERTNQIMGHAAPRPRD